MALRRAGAAGQVGGGGQCLAHQQNARGGRLGHSPTAGGGSRCGRAGRRGRVAHDGEQNAALAKQGKAELTEDRRRRRCPAHRDVVHLSPGRVVAGVLGAGGEHLDAGELEQPGDMDEKTALASVFLQQGEPQVGAQDGQRNARNSATGTDVDTARSGRRRRD